LRRPIVRSHSTRAAISERRPVSSAGVAHTRSDRRLSPHPTPLAQTASRRWSTPPSVVWRRATLPGLAAQTVRELTIFVPGNMGNEEETVIARLRLIGLPVEQTGAKRSEAEQAAASKADWLGSGIRGA